MLLELQFPTKAIRYVPVSGLCGENIVTISNGCALAEWYTGPTLLQVTSVFVAC